MYDDLIRQLMESDFERLDCTPFECGAFGLLSRAGTALTALQAENAEKDKEMARLQNVVEAYATSARTVSLWLNKFCDRSLPYDKMIQDAARKAADALSRVEAERDAAKRDIESILRSCTCEVRHEFCTRCAEPDGCDSDDCHDAKWRGAQGEG